MLATTSIDGNSQQVPASVVAIMVVVNFSWPLLLLVMLLLLTHCSSLRLGAHLRKVAGFMVPAPTSVL
jgi:hypothetical protein